MLNKVKLLDGYFELEFRIQDTLTCTCKITFTIIIDSNVLCKTAEHHQKKVNMVWHTRRACVSVTGV